MLHFKHFCVFVVAVTSEMGDVTFMLLRCKDERHIQTVKEQYFKSTLGHFGVFVVKLHPLLDDTADSRVRVVDELEAGDVGATFPQVCQVNVQETLRQAGDRQPYESRYQQEKMGRL